MFVVLLRFSENKAKAPDLMAGHNAWIQNGIDKDKFLVVGSLQPSAGGAILAHNVSGSELQELVSQDPFVAEDVVKAEIIEITPSKANDRLSFLLK